MGRTATEVILSEFEGHYMHLRPGNGKLWVTAREIGEALEYEDPARAINHLFNAHADEFDSDCTRIISIGHVGKNGYARIREFSIEGTMLLGMFSEQPLAKKFRKWARKVLTEVAVTGRYKNPKQALPGYRTANGEPHWTEGLSAAERLRLNEMRMTCWLKLADRPKNQFLWNAFYATFGGQAGYAEYLRKHELRVPETPEEWAEFENQDVDSGPGEAWFGIMKQ